VACKNLHEAAAAGDVKCVEQLLKRGSNPNARDKDSYTPLHHAAARGHVEVVKLLLKHGAEINARNMDENTPLHKTAIWGHPHIAEMLLERGAELHAKNKHGSTPLHEAAIWGRPRVAEVLLRHGADPNARNIYGFTPLHDAAYWGRADVAEVLLRYGADPSMKNNDGKTPLDLAKERGHTVVASILEKWMEGGGKGDGGVKVICDPYCETLKIIKQLHDIVMGSLRVTEREVEELASHVSNLRVHVDELTAIAAEIAPNAVRELVDSRKLIESAVDLLRQGNIQALREAVISRYYRMLSLGQRLGCRC